MVTLELDTKASEGKIIYKQSNAVLDRIPEGYMTAEEWRIRCKKNISEIFRKYEQGILYMISTYNQATYRLTR